MILPNRTPLIENDEGSRLMNGRVWEEVTIAGESWVEEMIIS
jgi:hypothetical protein